MPKHEATVVRDPRGIVPTCSCGWSSSPWRVDDGSAQQQAYSHSRKKNIEEGYIDQ